MTASTMINKLKKSAISFLVVLLWIGVWYVAALIVHKPLILPNPIETAVALLDLLCTAEFYKVVAFTLLRVLIGLVLGVVFGIAFAVVCHRFSPVKNFLSPNLRWYSESSVVVNIALTLDLTNSVLSLET